MQEAAAQQTAEADQQRLEEQRIRQVTALHRKGKERKEKKRKKKKGKEKKRKEKKGKEKKRKESPGTYKKEARTLWSHYTGLCSFLKACHYPLSIHGI